MAAKARLRLVEGRDAEGGWEALAPDWQALPGASLLGLPSGTRPPERRVALLHPRRGVAILDLMAEEAPPLSPRESAATVVALQGRLCAAGFPQVFPGHLPVLHLGVTEAALPGLVRRLDEAFRATAPLTLPEGEAWMGPLRRALTSLPGGLPLRAALNAEAAEALGLVEGQEALAMVKASEVVLVQDFGGYRLSASNQLAGTVSRVTKGATGSLVGLTLPGGLTLTASVTNDAVDALDLRVGQPATACFKASVVMLAVAA